MELEALTRQNPWWVEKEGIEKDEDIRKWEEGKIKWVPALLEEISLKPTLIFPFVSKTIHLSASLILNYSF
jgi:hypothetical protein